MRNLQLVVVLVTLNDLIKNISAVKKILLNIGYASHILKPLMSY